MKIKLKQFFIFVAISFIGAGAFTYYLGKTVYWFKSAKAEDLKKYFLECYKKDDTVLGSWLLFQKPTFANNQIVFTYNGKDYQFINTQCTLISESKND